MSKKTIGKILIILGILIAIFGLFLWNSREDKKEIKAISITENQTGIKTILDINGEKYESEISSPISVYDFMTQLQNEEKITFKDKTYTGMGKFIEEINGIKNNREKSWIYYVNNKKAQVGVSNYQLKPGDVVSWKLEKI